MSDRRKLPNINVDSVPNGFVLTVENKQYMAFSPMALLEEMFIRIGVDTCKYFDRDFVRNIVTAAAAYPDLKDATMAIAIQMGITEEVRNELRATRRELAALLTDKEQWSADKNKLLLRLSESERAATETNRQRDRADKFSKLYLAEAKKSISLEIENRNLRLKLKEMESRFRHNEQSKEFARRKKRTREQIEKDNFSDRCSDPIHSSNTDENDKKRI